MKLASPAYLEGLTDLLEPQTCCQQAHEYGVIFSAYSSRSCVARRFTQQTAQWCHMSMYM